ncbi:MAG: glycosyltransferase family 2 protein [bacterium]|nr:glycosyltransferase family 2 protein [bacterium]
MDKLYIIIPAYNEEETIKQVIDDWYPVIERIGNDSRLVIINDGSKDHTYEIIQEYAASRPYLLPLTKENGGHGATVLFGYHYAIKENADYIFQTDSDGQTLPDEFDAFWALRNEYDMIIGHRNKREDGASRVFVTKVLKFVLWVCFGVRVTDANTPFRLLKKETLAQYIDKVPENFNLSNVLISVIYIKNELKVKYIPITFRPRQGGVNSINLPKICKIGRQAFKDFRDINRSLKNS